MTSMSKSIHSVSPLKREIATSFLAQKGKNMSEFETGIFNLIKNTSVGRALVYTCGHIIIAMSVVSVLTGASLWEAAVALVEPTINGVWYYFLDKLFTMKTK